MINTVRNFSFTARILCLAVIFATAFTASGVASVKTIETEIMVACIYNFARFTSWPASNEQESFKITFTGDSIVQTSIGVLQNKKLNEKTLLVEKFHAENPEDFQIVFISSTEADATKEILARYNGKPVLTISDQPGFVASGGMIELFFLNNKIRFKINNRIAHKYGINISSQVLSLAHEVIK